MSKSAWTGPAGGEAAGPAAGMIFKTVGILPAFWNTAHDAPGVKLRYFVFVMEVGVGPSIFRMHPVRPAHV